MRMYLIYATKPELRALALVKDPSDAEAMIEKNLNVSHDRSKAAAERAAVTGGDVATLGIQRWSSARCAPVELEL